MIFLLLLFTFDSVWLAGLVLVNLPFAMVGGVFALFLSGLYLSVPASVGFIVLFGVAVLNGVVLISYISDLRDNGASVRRCGADRLRGAASPGADDREHLHPQPDSDGVRDGAGLEVQRPLAVVVIGGLVTSTALTLLVLPTLYQWFAPERREVELSCRRSRRSSGRTVFRTSSTPFTRCRTCRESPCRPCVGSAGGRRTGAGVYDQTDFTNWRRPSTTNQYGA